MSKKVDNLPYPLRHNLWAKDLARRVDRKTRRWINQRVRFLLQDISDPSPRELALVEHTVLLDCVCRVYAMALIAGEHPGSVDRFLSFEGHLQRNLCALGLNRRKKRSMSLQQYLNGEGDEES